MSLHSILQAIQDTGLAAGIRNSLLWFPVLEAVHVISIGLVFGTIMIVDLRILGLAGTERSYGKVSADVLKWTWAAFGLAILTGSLMFITNATGYVDNGFFRAKFCLMVLAGLNMLAFQLTAGKRGEEWGENPRGPNLGRAAAMLSLALWFGVILMGRVVGFTTTGVNAKVTPPAPSVNFDDFLSSSSSSSAPPASSTAP
jgi:hypothetical protein